MYSKQESAILRKEFWIAFDIYSHKYLGKSRKWITYNTGLKDFVLKFDVNRDFARVMLSIENRSEDKRFDIFVKLKEMELIFADILSENWIWDEQLKLENGKTVCSLFIQLDDVNIYNKNDWSKIFYFFATEMLKLEGVFYEIKPLIEDYIKQNK
ncbi:MAG TPA: DUF4268 domain-containing protein [Bacteroidales bacterium]|nr:DUF4268 domain-containing protein [Bacteroidales bacterium]